MVGGKEKRFGAAGARRRCSGYLWVCGMSTTHFSIMTDTLYHPIPSVVPAAASLRILGGFFTSDGERKKIRRKEKGEIRGLDSTQIDATPSREP